MTVRNPASSALSNKKRLRKMRPLKRNDEDLRMKICIKKKHAFKSYQTALNYAKVLNKKLERRMRPYKCIFCERYHIGGTENLYTVRNDNV